MHLFTPNLIAFKEYSYVGKSNSSKLGNARIKDACIILIHPLVHSLQYSLY